GTFPRDHTWGRGKRSLKNVVRILELPFDCDLKDFLGCDKDDLLALTDAELESYIDLQQRAVEDMFRRISLPIHRLDYTGYVLSAHVSIPLHDQYRVPEIKELHAQIVSAFTAIFGAKLADPQVKDAGPRIMRLVPCLN